MYIESLNQEIVVTSHLQVYGLLEEQPGFWNVLSICDQCAEGLLPPFEQAASVERLCFDDVLKDDQERGVVAACPMDLQRALAFSRKLGNAPLLIHCWAGVSRSTAMAWILIYDKLRATPEAVSRSYHIVRAIRPCLHPNPHVVRTGIHCLFDDPAQRQKVMSQFEVFLR